MHTVYVIAGGLGLLAVCLLAGRLLGASHSTSAYVFLPLWFIGAAINMWFGVTKAGYTVKEELPMFLIVFGVPAAIAAVVLWFLRAK